VRLHQAELLLDAGGWDEARPILETLSSPPIQGARDLSELIADRRAHAYHLLGLSRLYAGETELARSAFQAGADATGDGCGLRRLLDLAAPMEHPPRPEEWDATRTIGRQLLGAVRTADAALAAGDVETARRAVDRPIVWRECEVQSQARLARIYLEMVTENPRERFRKRLALALFLHVPEKAWYAWELLLPDVRWDASRLAELAARCSRWLETSEPESTT